MASNVIANLKILLSATWDKLRGDFNKAKQPVREFGLAVRKNLNTGDAGRNMTVFVKNLRESGHELRPGVKMWEEILGNITEGLSAGIDSFGGFGGAMGRALTGLKAVGGSIASLGPIALAAAASIGVLIAAFVALVAAIQFTHFGVMLAAETEQAQIAFETMLGSAQEAKQVLKDITKFSIATPFQKAELVDAGRKLAAFGVMAGDLVPTLRMLGDVSAGIGTPIGEIAEIFGKAKVQGRLFMEDINQLQGRGIPIMQAMADVLGVSAGEIRTMVSEGKIGFNDLRNAFMHLTREGSQFGGLMNKQSFSLLGLLSSIRDTFRQIAEEVGEVLLPAVKAVAHQILIQLQLMLKVIQVAKRVLLFRTGGGTELPTEDFSSVNALGTGALQVDRGVAAVEARSVAGFSAVQAAKRTAEARENTPEAIGNKILNKMDSIENAVRSNKVQVERLRA